MMTNSCAETQSSKGDCPTQTPESEISGEVTFLESDSDHLTQATSTKVQVRLGIQILKASFWISLAAIVATVALATRGLLEIFAAGSCTAALTGVVLVTPLVIAAVAVYLVGIALVNRHKAAMKKKATIAALTALVILPLSVMAALLLSMIPSVLSSAGIEFLAEMPNALSESEKAEFVQLIQQQADEHWGSGIIVVEDVTTGLHGGYGKHIARMSIVGLDEVGIEHGLWFYSLQEAQSDASPSTFKWDPDVIDDDTKELFRAFSLQTKEQINSWGQTEELSEDYPGREVWEVSPARKSRNYTNYVFEKAADGRWIFLTKRESTL